MNVEGVQGLKVRGEERGRDQVAEGGSQEQVFLWRVSREESVWWLWRAWWVARWQHVEQRQRGEVPKKRARVCPKAREHRSLLRETLARRTSQPERSDFSGKAIVCTPSCSASSLKRAAQGPGQHAGRMYLGRSEYARLCSSLPLRPTR